MQMVGSKKLKVLKIDDVVLASVPNFPELGVLKLYEIFKNDAEVMAYLPLKAAKCNKEFLWRILKTLRPQWTDKVLEDAVQRRENDLAQGSNQEV